MLLNARCTALWFARIESNRVADERPGTVATKLPVVDDMKSCCEQRTGGTNVVQRVGIQSKLGGAMAYRCINCHQPSDSPHKSLIDHFGDPRLLSSSGWYFVRNNSGDRWIAHWDPAASDFDPFYGKSEDDRIEVAGPIQWPS
jgi:hypothetical protein